MADRIDDLRMITRRLAWDIINHEDMYDPEVQRRFGLAPASPDVLDLEHHASEHRLHLVKPIYPRLSKLGRIASSISHRALLNYMGEEAIEDDEYFLLVFREMITAAATAILATLLDEHLISVNLPGETPHV